MCVIDLEAAGDHPCSILGHLVCSSREDSRAALTTYLQEEESTASNGLCKRTYEHWLYCTTGFQKLRSVQSCNVLGIVRAYRAGFMLKKLRDWTEREASLDLRRAQKVIGGQEGTTHPRELCSRFSSLPAH
jgi:hypothetical protein